MTNFADQFGMPHQYGACPCGGYHPKEELDLVDCLKAERRAFETRLRGANHLCNLISGKPKERE